MDEEIKKMKLFDVPDDPQAFFAGVFLLALVVALIAGMLGYQPEPPKPVKVPSAEAVGEKAGEKSTKFGKGFLKGSWDVIRGNK